jgi:hypothetical protein
VDDFANLHYGVATADRGWATTRDIANALSLDEFEMLIHGSGE